MVPNRRTVLSGSLSCAAAIAAGEGRAKAASPHECPRLSVGGELSCESKDLAAAAEDFGHVVRKQPRAMLKPASVADIAELLRWAGGRGVKVAARGQGHSVFGRAMTEGGVVIDMSAMNRIHRVETDRIVVDAGATWQAVLAATLKRGLAPPVLTNYLGLSVAGTIAVGGIGGSTSRYGMQTDNVLALSAVTADGQTLPCSPEQTADLFQSVRGGLGQAAVITSATLRLIRAPERVRRYQLFYSSLRALTADQQRVLGDDRFDQLQGAVLPHGGVWRYQLEGAVFYDENVPPDQKAILSELSDDRSAAVITDLTYLEDATAFARLEALLRSNGQWFNPHPWWLTFLPGSKAEKIAANIIKDLTHEDIGPYGRLTYYPMRTAALHTPLVRMPAEDIVFPFNIIRIPGSNDTAAAERMIAKNRALYDRVRSAGGMLYPVSAFQMSNQDWREHFGPVWPLLQEAKHRYDPHDTLTPGYGINRA